MSPLYLPTPPRSPWHRRTWNEHSTLPPELQAVKDRLLSRASAIPTSKTTPLVPSTR